jgi:hypothetical protein
MVHGLRRVEWVLSLSDLLEAGSLALSNISAYQWACVQSLRGARHREIADHNAEVDELARMLGVSKK